MNIGKMMRLERELRLLIQAQKPVPPKMAYMFFAPVLFDLYDNPSEFEFVPFMTWTPLPDGINHVGDFLRYAQHPDTRLTLHVRQMPFTQDYIDVMTGDEQTEWKVYGLQNMHKADQKEWSSWK